MTIWYDNYLHKNYIDVFYFIYYNNYFIYVTKINTSYIESKLLYLSVDNTNQTIEDKSILYFSIYGRDSG